MSVRDFFAILLFLAGCGSGDGGRGNQAEGDEVFTLKVNKFGEGIIVGDR